MSIKPNSDSKDLRNDLLLEFIYKLQNYYKDNKKIVFNISVALLFIFLFIILIFYYNSNRNNEANKIFVKSMSYYKNGDKNLALIELEDVNKNFTSTKKGNLSNYFIGKIYFENKNMDDAVTYINKYINKGNSKSYLSSSFSMLAMIQSNNNNHLEAAKNFKKASELAISNSFKNRLLFQSLDSYLRAKELKKSMRILEKMENNEDIQNFQKDDFDRYFNYYKILKEKSEKVFVE